MIICGALHVGMWDIRSVVLLLGDLYIFLQLYTST